MPLKISRMKINLFKTKTKSISKPEAQISEVDKLTTLAKIDETRLTVANPFPFFNGDILPKPRFVKELTKNK